MSIDEIKITKASLHNLKSININIPRNKLVVITGPSGSGKSSLAFDTIYVEGQRRYIESLSSYARQFLDQYQAPEVESITGLSPTLAIDQSSQTTNPRSTIGTVTEIYDYLRVLYARIGEAKCPECKRPVQGQSIQKMVDSILKLPVGSKIHIMAPILRDKKGEYKDDIQKFMAAGINKVRLNGELISLDQDFAIPKNKKNNLDIVIDRILVKPERKSRLLQSLELALKYGQSTALILDEKNKEHLFSEKNHCPYCDLSFPDLSPRLFSFNSPVGACQKCNGLGEIRDFDQELIIKDENLSFNEGAILPLNGSSFFSQMIKCVAKKEKLDLSTPIKKWPKKFKTIFFNGSDQIYTYSFNSENSTFNFKKEFPGLINWLNKKYLETNSEKVRSTLDQYIKSMPCTQCNGLKLNNFSLAIKINDKNISELCQYGLDQALNFIQKLKLDKEKKIIADKILKEVVDRIKFMLNVGLNYLTLDRKAKTLSGGESQRIRLATQLGSCLSGVIYVLDEPSIGLHAKDNQKLIQTIRSLCDLGNSVLVVEHDEETMLSADHIIDMGPTAGINGGEVICQGNLEKIKKHKLSLTGKYLRGELVISIDQSHRPKTPQFLCLKGAKEHNLKSVDAQFPIGQLTCLTGVSGSGKSTLLHKVLVPALKSKLKISNEIMYKRNNYQSITGHEYIKNVIELDQTPIGRTPKSNPATYTGIFDEIRTLFSKTPQANVKGYRPGRFSFNVKGGRCEECEGNGVKKIEMHFLPDVYITCESCEGKRYNQETLSIKYKGKDIAETLSMSIEEAYQHFKNHFKLAKNLKLLNDIGLGYVTLGQPATTLSGGEAQRLKLARELGKSFKGPCLYILDEPTTGLHFNDINILLNAISKLVDQGHTVIIIEHNLDVIKCSDHIVDIGPEGGEKGGEIIFQGDMKSILKCKKSYTGKFLKEHLKSRNEL